MRRGRLAQKLFGGIDEMPARSDNINQPHALRFFAINAPSGQHQIERLGCTDQSRHTLGTAPAGDDADHHFRQRHFGFRTVVHDAVAASQRQLGAAAHTKSVNHRQRGKRQCGNLVKHFIAQHRHCIGFIGCFE